MTKKADTITKAMPIASKETEQKISSLLKEYHPDFPYIFQLIIYTDLPYNDLILKSENELLNYSHTVYLRGHRRRTFTRTLPKELKQSLKGYFSQKASETTNYDPDKPFLSGTNTPTRRRFEYALFQMSDMLNLKPAITFTSLKKTYIYHLYNEGIALKTIRICRNIKSYDDLLKYLHLGETYDDFIRPVNIDSPKYATESYELMQRLQQFTDAIKSGTIKSSDILNDLNNLLTSAGY